MVIARRADREDYGGGRELRRLLVEAPALTRRLYRRGGFEGLEPNTMQVLIALDNESGQSVGQLVDLLVLGQGTVSTALARLQADRLVDEAVDDGDRRKRVQAITKEGRAVVQRFVADARVRGDATYTLPE